MQKKSKWECENGNVKMGMMNFTIPRFKRFKRFHDSNDLNDLNDSTIQTISQFK